MRNRRYNLNVDAGNISLISEDIVKKYGFRDDYKGQKTMINILNLKKGQKIVISFTEGTWRNFKPHSFSFTSKKAGKYYLGDACYYINDWHIFLKDTDFMRKSIKNSKVMDTGGDGSFKIVISDKKILLKK